MAIARKLTLEQKKALMGVAGFATSSVFSYVPTAFKRETDDGKLIFPKKLWTVYKLLPLTMGEYDELQKIRDERDNYASELSERILTEKIQGISNFYDASGDKLEYTGIDQIPVPIQIELIVALMMNAFLTDEELEGLDS